MDEKIAMLNTEKENYGNEIMINHMQDMINTARNYTKPITITQSRADFEDVNDNIDERVK